MRLIRLPVKTNFTQLCQETRMYYFRPFVLAVCMLTGVSAYADEVGTGSGSVAEIIDVWSYTYIRLKQQNRWIATTRLVDFLINQTDLRELNAANPISAELNNQIAAGSGTGSV